jgi:hypothetical protein
MVSAEGRRPGGAAILNASSQSNAIAVLYATLRSNGTLLEGPMEDCPADPPLVVANLQFVTHELHRIESELLGAGDIDPSILSDFRNAVNRVRTTAWGVQRYADAKAMEVDPSSVLSLLAGERIRVVFQLAKLIETDIANPQIRLQQGQLGQLHGAIRELEKKLKRATKA